MRRSSSASARQQASLAGPDDDPENPGPEWRTKWSTLDLKQANDLLDKIGLTKKDASGMRLRTDNGQILRLEVITGGELMLPWGQQMERVSQHWKKIGIQLDVKDIERSLADKTTQSNGHQIRALGAWRQRYGASSSWSRHDMPTEPPGAVQRHAVRLQGLGIGSDVVAGPEEDVGVAPPQTQVWPLPWVCRRDYAR